MKQPDLVPLGGESGYSSFDFFGYSSRLLSLQLDNPLPTLEGHSVANGEIVYPMRGDEFLCPEQDRLGT